MPFGFIEERKRRVREQEEKAKEERQKDVCHFHIKHHLVQERCLFA